MSENTGEVQGTVPANEPAVEPGKHKVKKAREPKKAEGEREFKIVHLDTGDEAAFKRLKLPKDENDPHWDHRMTMDVPEHLIESMVERQLPTTIEVEADGDDYLIDDGRTRVRAIPEVNRRRKKLGKPAFVLTLAVAKPREKSIDGDRDTIQAAFAANVRMDDPPTVQAMHISRALRADVTEQWIVAHMPGMNFKKLHEYLALLDLPKKVQAHVDDGTISISAALAMTKLDEKDVEAAAEKLAAAAKVGKKVSAAAIAPKKGEDKVATKKDTKQFCLDLSGDPFEGKHGEAVTKAIVLGVELAYGMRSIAQATAAGTRLAKGEAVKIDFKQFQTDGK